MKTRWVSALALTGTIVVAGCCCLCGGGSKTATVGLMTDQLVSPANVGAKPVFSWNMKSERTGAAQTAYRLKLFEVCGGKKEVWDSGEVACGKSVAVKYGGPALKSARKYFWEVQVKDE